MIRLRKVVLKGSGVAEHSACIILGWFVCVIKHNDGRCACVVHAICDL